MCAAALGALSLVGAAVTLCGWIWNLPQLTDWMGLGISMLPNTAICAGASGLALILGAENPRTGWRTFLVRALAIFTAVLGGAILFQHATGINLHVDALLLDRSWGQNATAAPMRMGPPASVAFLLQGLGMFLSTRGMLARKVAGGLAVSVLFIAVLSLTGYWFGANQLFGLARVTGIAWQTAAIIALLGLGLVLHVRDHGLMAQLRRDDAGGIVARRLILPLITIPLLLGWLRLLGQQAGLYDQAFGAAIRSLVEIALFLGLLWWTASSISRHATAARTAGDALRASQESFNRFMESLPGLAWIKDREGRYIYANQSALRVFGRSLDELTGTTDRDFLPAEVADEFRENDRLALASGSGVQVIEALDHGDGTHLSLVSKFPIPDGDGMLVGGIAIDVTDRLKAEEALREADRRKDEFLATLAHELRNPLAPIRFAAQMLKDRATSAQDTSWSLDVIERQVQQMARLLEDLLDVSRISHGKLALRKEHIELRLVIERAIETSQPVLAEGGQRLSMHIPAGSIVLDADPVRLAQVFANLLNNAAKYTPPETHVHVAARMFPGSVEVAVSDDGPGLAPEILPRIFEMFSQAPRTRRSSHGGLGIGLSLVRGLVELHDGEVEARSEGAGKGSTFYVRLPLASTAQAAPTPPARGQESPGRITPLRILVADDLRDTADSVSAFLRSKGHEVATAYDGEEAVALADRLRPDVALLDVGMPRLSGHDVCRRLREQPWARDLVVIAITGWGRENDRLLTAEAGFDHHFVKPVDISTLERLIADTRARG